MAGEASKPQLVVEEVLHVAGIDAVLWQEGPATGVAAVGPLQEIGSRSSEAAVRPMCSVGVAAGAGEAVASSGDGRSAYAGIGGAAGVRRVADEFYRRVTTNEELAVYFGAEPGVLRWHQAAQLCLVLDGPDRYRQVGLSGEYLPVTVPAVLYHRAAACLVGALLGVPARVGGVPGEQARWKAVDAVASALAAGRCRLIGGGPPPGALVPAERELWRL